MTYHNGAHIVDWVVGQHFAHMTDVSGGDEDASRTTHHQTVLLTGEADRGRVDEGHHLGGVGDEHLVEEHSVAVLQLTQVHVLGQGVVAQQGQTVHLEAGLLLKAANGHWQEALQVACFTFFRLEGEVLVESGRDKEVNHKQEKSAECCYLVVLGTVQKAEPAGLAVASTWRLCHRNKLGTGWFRG